VGDSTAATYVLLPGAGGESWYWYLVTPELRARGHEVVTPDLPAADDRAGLGAYADAVLAAVGDRTDIIVVAQSMAAYIAPMLCDRVDVRLIILVAPMIPAPRESPGAWWSSSGQTAAQRQQDEREGRDPDAEFDVKTTLMHDLPPDVVAEAFARGEPRQSDTPFGDPWPMNEWPPVPTRVIAARHDRLFPLEFMRRLARDRLGLDVDVIDTGHLPALSRPEELAQRLEAYLLEQAGAAAADPEQAVPADPEQAAAADPVFYFDFGSPYAYLAAERMDRLIPNADWRPIAFPILLHHLGRLEAALARNPRAVLEDVSPRANERGLPPIRPPKGWPVDTWSLAPLRAALFAGEHDRLKEFTTAAFAKVFVESRPLTETANPLAAAREAGLDASEVEQAIERPEIKQRLKDHTDEALATGVTGIPTVAVGDQLFWGDDRLEEAAAAAGTMARSPR
jgi:2-hydroxychromene-2-carboxylate isomerase/pimeloyl-ACP methyl ester carboxylesterase